MITLPADVAARKEEFKNALVTLDVKKVRQLLHLNILQVLAGDELFCPLQEVIDPYYSVYRDDFSFPLRQQMFEKFKAILKLLIQHGADVNYPVYGSTPLDKIMREVSDGTSFNFQIFNLLIDHGATIVRFDDHDEATDGYKPYIMFMMRYVFCRKNKPRRFWLMKKVILLGVYSINYKFQSEQSFTDYISVKGKRLINSLPNVFLLYCFQQRQITAML